VPSAILPSLVLGWQQPPQMSVGQWCHCSPFSPAKATRSGFRRFGVGGPGGSVHIDQLRSCLVGFALAGSDAHRCIQEVCGVDRSRDRLNFQRAASASAGAIVSGSSLP
jgi:hypothetical protein